MDEHVKATHGRDRFFGIDFTTGTIPQIRELVAQAARSVRTTVVVTPNVDHIVGLSERLPEEVRSTYFSADTFFCDSKIIGRLARWNDLDLTPRTGTDRVADVLACDALQDLVVAVAGPTAEQTEALRKRFPGWRFIHIETPQKLVRGTIEWQACVDEASRQPWNILLSCLSFPKQEIFACDVRAARISSGGVILCVGAAVDFLSGSQARAPMFFQRFGLEWFHRLITNPRRLWKRYLVEGPRIFLLYRKRRRGGTLL